MANTLNSTNNIEVMNSIVGKEISEYEDDTLKKVGKNAFRGCGELSSVTLPSVKSLGEKAFKDCESLEDITVGMNYDGVVSVEDDTFDGCNPVNVIVPKDKVDLYKNSDSWSGFVGTDGVLTVNWGKCGGEDDVIVTYKEGDPLWVPRAYLKYKFTGTAMAWDSVVELEPSTVKDVGFVRTFSKDGRTSNGSYIYVFKLPQNLGEYLYDNSEDWNSSFSLGDYNHSSMTIAGVSGGDRNYKGIAIYPNTATSWYSSNQWGIGIRKKSDLHIIGYSSSGSHPLDETFKSTIQNTTQWAELEDDAYYMVAEGSSSSGGLLDWLSCWSGTDETNPVYFRHYNTMNRPPHWTGNNTPPSSGAVGDATNVGKEYTAPSELIDGFVKNTSKSGTQGSIYGLKDSFTVNWGKCGGNDDVIVTYKKGEGLWIPKEFLAQAYDPSTNKLYGTEKAVYGDGSVGYYCHDWMNSPTARPIAVYVLPQDFGRWLYDNAEDQRDRIVYNSTLLSGEYIYKGIAVYPDTVSSWNGSYGWGVGIRKGDDIDVYSCDASGNKTLKTSSQGLSHYDKNTYYLVFQATGDGTVSSAFLQGLLSVSGNNRIYFRHFNTMTTEPSATNQGKKYDLDMSIQKSYTLPLTVNWGKCGGEEDVIVNYDKEEGLWIPKEFLEQGWSSTYSPKADALFLSDGVTKDTSVGYKTWFGWGDKNGVTTRQTIQYSELYITVYKLPQALGEYLYNNAESHISRGPHYIGSSHGSTDNYLYKGIAIYPDTLKTSSRWDNARHFGVGIRKKNDIPIIGLDSDYTPTTSDIGNTSDYSAIYNLSQWKALEDDAYYLVCQGCLKNHVNWNSQIPYFIEEYFDDGNIYFRHWNTLTSAPTSDTSTHGKKYDVPLSLPPDNAKPLGGKIFYIDPTDNGATYTFYDSSGNKVKGTTVSELASAKYYVKSGESTGDKFYVYYPTKFDSLQWGYYNTLIGTGTAVGTGKTNTATVMARTDIETGTIWSKLSEIRTSSGIGDWFVPSKDEIDKFREADLEAWHRKSDDSNLWSSSEYSAPSAWYWYCLRQYWSYYGKTNTNSVFFARAF